MVSNGELLYRALFVMCLKQWFPSHSACSNWWMRRVGRRKLFTQWGPVGCAQAVSRYSYIGSNDFGPVEEEPFQM